MASLLRVAHIAAQWLLRGDATMFLLVWSMKGAIKIDKHQNDNLNRLEGNFNISLTETIVLRTTAEYASREISFYTPEISFPEMDPYQISETLSEILTTVTTPAADTSSITIIAATETLTITTTATAETPAITTATPADTTVMKDTKRQSQEIWLDTQDDLLGCNFPQLYLGSFRLRPPPLDVSNRVGLQHWEAAARQLGEIRRLIKANEETMARKYGSASVGHLRSELDNFVDKPLRFGCMMLPYLQTELLRLNTDTAGFYAGKRQRRIALVNLLDDVETKIRQSPWESLGLTILPAWAREAPELRSEACPNQDCFRVGRARLESVTQDIPEKLLFAVLDIKDHAKWNLMNFGKALLRRIEENILEVDSAFIDFYESGQFYIALLISLLLFNVSLFLLRFWPTTYDSVVARPRARRFPTPPPPEPGLFDVGGPAEAVGGPPLGEAVGDNPAGNEAAVGNPAGNEAVAGSPAGDEAVGDPPPGNEAVGGDPTGDEAAGDNPAGNEAAVGNPPGNEAVGDPPPGNEAVDGNTPANE